MKILTRFQAALAALALSAWYGVFAAPYCETDKFDGKVQCETGALAADGYWLVQGFMLRSQVLELRLIHHDHEPAGLDGAMRYKIDDGEPHTVELTDAVRRNNPDGTVVEIGRYALTIQQFEQIVSATDGLWLRIAADGGYEDIRLSADSQTVEILKAFYGEVQPHLAEQQ